MTRLIPLALAAVGAVAIALALFSLLAPDDRPRLLSRLLSIYSDQPEETEPVKAARGDALRAGFDAAVGHRLERSPQGSKIARRLALAELDLKAAEWMGITLGVCIAAGGLLTLRFGSPLGFPVGAALGYGGCHVFLTVRQSRRRKRFEGQLPGMIIALSNALKAGFTFAQSIDAVSRTAKAPMARELHRVVREMKLGVPVGEALAKMVERNDSEDLRLLQTAVQIQQQVGGNLPQVLDNIELTIRDRVRIKGEIKTLTSQARVSGWILTGLPFALGGVLSLSAPSYFKPMFTNLIGQIMLGISGFSLLMGYLIIRKIVRIEV